MKIKWSEKPFRKGSIYETLLRDFCKKHNTKIRLCNRASWASGFCSGEKEGIRVYLKKSRGRLATIQDIFSTVAHEIGHLVSNRRKKFPLYGLTQADRILSKRELRGIVKTGYRAECYTDKIGKELLKKTGLKIRYLSGYSMKDKTCKKWYQDNYMCYYKHELARR